jgi:hypothetical protein
MPEALPQPHTCFLAGQAHTLPHASLASHPWACPALWALGPGFGKGSVVPKVIQKSLGAEQGESPRLRASCGQWLEVGTEAGRGAEGLVRNGAVKRLDWPEGWDHSGHTGI